MSTLTHLDAYCERAGDASFWAEPLNAITNIAFLVAAYYCICAIRTMPKFSFRAHGDIAFLVVSLIAIGIGSGLWHTHATLWSVWADVIPITLFINIYLIAALRRLFGYGWGKVAVLWGMYQGITVLAQMQLPPDFMNGTVMYLPTYGALFIMTMLLSRHDKPSGRVFEVALLAWTLSLFFRTVDLEFCQLFPWGTHFLWHVINSFVLYRLLALLIHHIQSKVHS